MIEEKSLGYTKRTRVNMSTTAKGLAQVDITVELSDGTAEEITTMLDEAIKLTKQTVESNGFTLAG